MGESPEPLPQEREAAGNAANEDILIVNAAGRVTPLSQSTGQDGKFPVADKTLPLNQRFARMWRIPQRLLERIALENSLRRAIYREELDLYFQPQASVETGRIVGSEALVRWRHADRGLLLPRDFIPLAEETGLITALGEWVLRTACRYSSNRQKAGLPPMPVAVNLSAREFHHPNLVEFVAHVLEESRLQPELLELEITEGTALQNPETSIPVLHKLRDLGVRISIDDFGVGYSSLGYLKDLPVHTLKIDRSLVHDITRKGSQAAIAVAILAMAEAMKLDVVAEGVETEDELAFLKAHHCDKFQGFLLGRPMPNAVFNAMLTQHELTDLRPGLAA